MGDKGSESLPSAPAPSEVRADRRESYHSSSGGPLSAADHAAVAGAATQGGAGGSGGTRSQSALKKIGSKLGFRKKHSVEDSGEQRLP